MLNFLKDYFADVIYLPIYLYLYKLNKLNKYTIKQTVLKLRNL